MKRKPATLMMLTLVVAMMALTTACSMNRQTPKSFDRQAMEGDVRAAIAAAVPAKTFALEVDVTHDGFVTLSGHVNDQTDKDAIIAKVRQVNGVKGVNASGIHVM